MVLISYYVTYSPLFTGSMDDPDTGVQIEDYENFEHIVSVNEWAFAPEVQWETDTSQYPRTQYAYLYGFTYSDDELSYYDFDDSFTINKLSPGSNLFYNVWYAVATTCEPFSVMLYEGASFPQAHELVTTTDPQMYRMDCEPGNIKIFSVPICGEGEELDDEYNWDVDTYREERYLGGINY